MCVSELLPLARMARRIHVSQAWLREEAKAGRVPHLPAGKRLLFNAIAVEEALANQAAKIPSCVEGSQ